MKFIKKLSVILLTIVLVVSTINPSISHAAAKLNKTKATMYVGDVLTLKLSGTTKKISWSTSNKSVVTVKEGKITAKKAGTAKVTAKAGGKKYTCAVTVKNAKKYGEGMYKVGKDMPAGEYVLFTNSKYSAYFEVCKNSSGSFSSIISNDNFDYNSIITVKKGNYLKLTRCYAISINAAKVNTAGSGTFLVGKHIKPGEYKLVSTSKYSSYYEVCKNSSGSFTSIISNDNFSKSAYITVEKGDYLTLVRCKIKK